MNKILCSVGAVIGRPNGRDFTLLKSCVPKLECDGYEFLMYDNWYEIIDEIKRFIANIDAPFPVFHIEKGVGDLISRNRDGDTTEALKLFKVNCELAKAIGSDKLVLHLWSGLDSDKDIGHNIECYKYLRDISDGLGISLTVENVVCNKSTPMNHLITLAEIYPDIEFTFDTKMAAFHSELDSLYAEENRRLFKHIRHIHVNDYNGGYKDWKNLNTLHIGEGHIDFDKFFAFLKEMKYNAALTVEATSFDQNGQIDFESLNRSFSKIREYNK